MIKQINDAVKIQLESLQALLEQKKKALGKYPAGSLRISKSNGCPQYFLIQEGEAGKGTYLPRKKRNLAKSLAQKDYDTTLIPLIESEIKLLQHFLQKSTESQIFNLYPQLHPARKALANPIYLPDEEFAFLWQSSKYQKKSFSEVAPEHFTDCGLQVRSKSEVIIANKLTALKVPFRYEASLQLKATRNRKAQTITLHPDFTCLNKRTRQEFIWEHFGMMDDPHYANNAVEKERFYSAAGYIPGVNFIATTETIEHPLNAPYVEQIIKTLLL